MPVAVCPLCRLPKELVKSHLAPKAMYKYSRNPNEKNSVAIVVTRRGAAKVTRQVKQYLLCSECDKAFSKNGEDYVMRLVWNGKRFPLLDLLNFAVELRHNPEWFVYSGIATGIDTEKLAYFALSVLWRASVCEWRTSKVTSHRITLGSHEEILRQYLHGEAGYPTDVCVMAVACTDIYSRTFYMPSVATFPSTVPIPRSPFWLSESISLLF